jgi:hypothetical protein
LIRSQTSKPLMSGSPPSRITRSTARVASVRSASAPVDASMTWCPLRCSQLLVM